MLNIDEGGFASTANIEHTVVSTTCYDWKFSVFHSYSSSPDIVSSIIFTSTLPDMEFDLTSTSAGPNSYHAGIGTFFWGTDLTHEWSAPETLVEGEWTFKGETYAVDSSQFLAWFERQWSPCFPAAGHHFFEAILSNRLRIAIWVVNAVGANAQQAFVMVLDKDCSHDVHPIDPSIHASDTFTANITGNTYDSSYLIEVLGIATLQIIIAVQIVETVNATTPNLSAVFFEFFTTMEGV